MVVGRNRSKINKTGNLQVLAIKQGADQQPLFICRQSENNTSQDSDTKEARRYKQLRLYYSMKTGDLLISKNTPKKPDTTEQCTEPDGTSDTFADIVQSRKRSILGLTTRSRRTQTKAKVREHILTQESGCQVNIEDTLKQRRQSAVKLSGDFSHPKTDVYEDHEGRGIGFKQFNDLRKSPVGKQSEQFSEESENELSTLNEKEYTPDVGNQEDIEIPKLEMNCGRGSSIDTVYRRPNFRGCSNGFDIPCNVDTKQQGHNNEFLSQPYVPCIRRNAGEEVPLCCMRSEFDTNALTYGELLSMTKHIKKELNQLQYENEMLHELNESLCSRTYGICSTSRDVENRSSRDVSVELENMTREELVAQLVASLESNIRLREHVDKMTLSILERNESMLDISKK